MYASAQAAASKGRLATRSRQRAMAPGSGQAKKQIPHPEQPWPTYVTG